MLSREITKDDLLILVSARKKTLSFDNYLDNIPGKLMRYFQQNNFILLYPEQAEVKALDGGLQQDDISLSPIEEQLENFNKIGKAVKKIFQKGKPAE